MQFKTLSVAMAVLAVVVVVMAADPAPSADVLHAKCYHNGERHWKIAGEELDEEAMKTVPQEYSAMGWRKWRSGKCSYKSGHADCPNKWFGDEHHWDKHYGYKKLYHACDDNQDCCSNTCLKVRNSSDVQEVCCPKYSIGFNKTTPYPSKCCSKQASNSTGILLCTAPVWT